jgi:hypothetical protein
LASLDHYYLLALKFFALSANVFKVFTRYTGDFLWGSNEDDIPTPHIKIYSLKIYPLGKMTLIRLAQLFVVFWKDKKEMWNEF